MAISVTDILKPPHLSFHEGFSFRMVDNVDSLKAYTFKRGLNANFSVMFEVNILINLIGKYFTQLVISGTETPSYHYSFFVPGFFFISFFIQQVLISHPFNTHQCIHVNPNLPIHHTTNSTCCCFPPLVSICLFPTSVSQFLPCKPVHLYHFCRFHIYALICDICFSLSDLLHAV